MESLRWKFFFVLSYVLTWFSHSSLTQKKLKQGSITGAYSPHTDNVVPSFILLSIQDTKLVCYVYELVKNEVEVSKTEFTKTETEGGSKNPALMQSLLS